MALTQFQYDEIEREYSRRQLKSQRELSKRIDYISKTIPEIDRINREISSSSLEQARKILQSDTPEDSTEYHKNIQKLIKKKGCPVKGARISGGLPEYTPYMRKMCRYRLSEQ